MTSLEDKYQINKSRELFKGKVLEPKDKLKSLFEKEIKNLSVGIQVYSFYVAKNALIKILLDMVLAIMYCIDK